MIIRKTEVLVVFGSIWTNLGMLNVDVISEAPSKTDLDVLRALENTSIPAEDYPLMTRWKADVMAYPEDVRNRFVEDIFYFFVSFV